MKRIGPLLFLAAALAVAVVILFTESPKRPRVDDATEEAFFEELSSDKVYRAEVTQLLEGVELKRDGERWLARKTISPLKAELLRSEGRSEPEGKWVRADRVRANSSLGSLIALPRGVMVSSNEEKRPLYSVEATSLRLKLFDEGGNLLEDVVIGKNGPDFGSSYVRRSAEDDVFLVPRTLTGVFSPVLDDWRERKIWVIDPKDVKGISVESGEASFAAVRDGDGWRPAQGGEGLDAEAMEGIAKALSNVRAMGFPEEGAPQPGEVLVKLTIERENSPPLALTVYGKEKGGAYPAKLQGIDETYLLTEDFVKSIPMELPTRQAQGD